MPTAAKAGPSKKRALAVTARRPVLGSVKTRLAATAGDETALAVYRHLLRTTFEAAAQVRADDRFVALLEVADGGAPDGGGDPSPPLQPDEETARALQLPDDRWRLIRQRGTSLGPRLGNLFADLIGLGYGAVVFTNGDSPRLPPEYLEQAFDRLDRDEPTLVLGPTADGGFYLIGLDATTWRDHEDELREALATARLGTAAALQDVEHAARAFGLEVLQLPLWVDIDTADDLPLYERLAAPDDHARCLRGEPLGGLRDVYLHVTNRCECGCPHCYNRPNPREAGELTTSEWRDVIDQCADLGTGSFVVIGGDPFLRGDLLALIDHITGRRERKVRIFFNGACDADQAARLAEAGRGRLRPLLSVDGTREANDLIRGRGNYDETLGAIAELSDHGLSPVVNTVLLTPVLPTLPDLARELKRAGAAQIHLILPHERGAILENEDLIPSGTALRAAMSDLVAAADEVDLPIDNMPAWRRRLQSPRDFCTAGCRDIAVDPFGKVYACTITCGDPAFVAGDLRAERLEDIWRHSPALELVRAGRARDRGECAACPVVDACGGECWVQAHYAARARGVPAGLRASFPYCDLIRPLFEEFMAAERAGRPGPTCGPDQSCETAATADGGQAAAGESAYALFDCI